MKKIIILIVSLLSVLSLTSCASKYMKAAGPDALAGYMPSAGDATVVFMRPSSFGGAIQSSVFDVTTEKNVFVGIVSSSAKVAYRTTPGVKTFMVVGESADFMKAELAAGKVYYALVTPRMGVWKARFSLRPVHKEELSGDEFKGWNNGCELVENTPESFKWAKDNAPSIQEKRIEYFEKWMSKSESERPFLKTEDGM